MRSQLLTYFRGSVRLSVRGERPDELLNRCTAANILVWDVRRLGERMEMSLHLGDFFRLRPLLKETGCRAHVTAREGLPFALQRVERRKFFAAGLVLFVAGLYVLSSVVWSVQVTGNERIPTEEVLSAAKKHGIRALQWKFRLREPVDLARHIQNELPDAAWIGVEIRGTQVRIEVVEAARPNPRPLMNPRHLVAAHDAVITRIHAERGRPMVRVHQAVRKGQILISGLIGSEDPQGNRAAVVAEGTVRGLVMYEYHLEMPLVLQRKVYTGESYKRGYAVIGNRGIQVTGYGKPEYAQQEILAERTGIAWRGYKLPFGWLTETVMETRTAEERLTVEDARNIAVQQAAADLIAKVGADAGIVTQKILHEAVDNGKVYIKALFEVEQSIVAERAIIPEIIEQGD
jgi:similar to stage IV sporulation protein